MQPIQTDIAPTVMDNIRLCRSKLGRDANGNPAWFVADPERPGKYLMVK
ncbi:MAG: hypothetical protein R2847_11330 [Bacteroidia bacterium]